MKDGECIKCGKKGHIGKECRTGWKYDAAAPAVTTVEKDSKKKKRTKEEAPEDKDALPQKRRLIDQPDGSIKTIASRFEELSDSGKD